MAKSKSRKLADFISDSAIDTAELADSSITPAKLDSTGAFTVGTITSGTSGGLNTSVSSNAITARSVRYG